METPEIEYYETPEEIVESWQDGSLNEHYPMLCKAISLILEEYGIVIP